MRARLGSVRASRQLLLPGPALLDGAAFPGLHNACSTGHNLLFSSSGSNIEINRSPQSASSSDQPNHSVQAGTIQEEASTLPTVLGATLKSTGPYSPSQQRPLPSHSCGLPLTPEPRCTTGAPPASHAPPPPHQGPLCGLLGGFKCLGASRTVTGAVSGPGSGGIPSWKLQWQRWMSITESEDASIAAKQVRMPVPFFFVPRFAPPPSSFGERFHVV